MIMCRENHASFEFFQSISYGAEISKVLISGGCARISGISQYFTDKLHVSTDEFDPLKQVVSNNWKIDTNFLQEVAPRLAVGIGLALRGVMK